MTKSHMALSGIPPDEEDYVQARARAAERWYAALVGGSLRERMAEDGYDVILPSGTAVDVKRVPYGFRFVNGGAKRLRSLVVVVQDRGFDDFAAVGMVPVTAWRWAAPPGIRPPRVARPCWMVLRDELIPYEEPPSASPPDPEPSGSPPGDPEAGHRLELGYDDPPAVDPAEAKRLKDRLAQRRMTARRKAAIGMPWADPGHVGRGLGAGGGGRPARQEADR